MKRSRTGARIRTMAVALSAVLITAGCSAGGTNSGDASTVEFNVGAIGLDVSNIDPGRGMADQVNSYVQDYLMKLSPTGEVEPNLAESVEQPDDVTYVYTLRDDVTFSNGKPLTAADVVASLDHERNPEFSESWRYAAIADIEATDDRTVVITLNAPTVSFQYVLAMNGYIFDSEHQAEHPDDFGMPGVGVIGTGPYVIDKLDATNGVVTFSANEEYWGEEPEIDKITLTSFSDENSAALAFRTGEIDLAFPVDVRSFETTADVEATSVPGTRQGLFIMNNTVAPWDDVHVRRAVAYAINKEDLVKVMGGTAEPDSTIIPPTQLLSIASQEEVDELMASLPSYSFDLDKAKAELEKSEYPDGFQAELQTAARGGFAEASQAIAGQLKEIGIDIDVKVLSDAEYRASFSKPHTATPLWYTYFNNNTPDAGGMPRLALDSAATDVGQNNFADYVNPEVDALIKKADATVDPAERFAAYSDLLRIVADDMPYVPLFAGDINIALSDGFEWPEFNAYSTDHTPFITQISPK
ncbi:ABC transporter substrate-binding protein [Microbacterium sp. NPDC058342]|uniref:ABC transporter substrate-binding protein n=1 Tax=Microbacterium sp. NPDC058342 TaxID=3346454 RepID=UPI0036502295